MLATSNSSALTVFFGLAILAFAASGCSGNVAVSSGNGGGSTASGGTGGAASGGTGGAAQGGSGGATSSASGGTGGTTTGTDCNDLVDNGPNIHPACPGVGGGNGPCPDCTEGSPLGGTIAEGTYVMKKMTVWASACGSVVDVSTHATLVVEGDKMHLVSTGPQGFGPQEPITQRLTLLYTVNGTSLMLQELCPSAEEPYSIGFTVQDKLLVVGQMPGLFGMPTFELQ